MYKYAPGPSLQAPPEGSLCFWPLHLTKQNVAQVSRVWLKIKQGGLRRFWSMFPLTRVPFWYRAFEPQPARYKIGRIDVHNLFAPSALLQTGRARGALLLDAPGPVGRRPRHLTESNEQRKWRRVDTVLAEKPKPKKSGAFIRNKAFRWLQPKPPNNWSLYAKEVSHIVF